MKMNPLPDLKSTTIEKQVQVSEPAWASAVIFGHHRGDIQENVISNVMRGRGPGELSGMGPTSHVEGVHVWRPLLAHDKQRVYDFSRRYGVPYFRDTTPSWSTRGKLRNQLIPLLVDIFGEGCLSNLSNLATASDEMGGLLDVGVFGPFIQSVSHACGGVSVDVLPHADMPEAFWQHALMTLMHSMSMPKVTKRGVSNFLGRLLRLRDAKRTQAVELDKEEEKASIRRNHGGGGDPEMTIPEAEVRGTISSGRCTRLEPRQGISDNSSTINSADIVQERARQGAKAGGWLEIRKGALSYLREDGRLFIYNVRVIGAIEHSSSSSSPSPAKGRSSKKVAGAARIGPKEMALMTDGAPPSASSEQALELVSAKKISPWSLTLPSVNEKSTIVLVNGWEVTVRLQYYKQEGNGDRKVLFGAAHAHACARDKGPSSMRCELTMDAFLEALHRGSFSYSLQVPTTCTTLGLFSRGSASAVTSPKGNGIKQKLIGRSDKRMVALCAPALAGVDAKLADALPLLVPELEQLPDEDASLRFRRFRVEFSFVGHDVLHQALPL